MSLLRDWINLKADAALDFPSVKRSKVKADFAGGDITGNADRLYQWFVYCSEVYAA